jgi:hypothetical protein
MTLASLFLLIVVAGRWSIDRLFAGETTRG